MSLFNDSPIPSGLRCCYWDANYIASQPFCLTSKLTEEEAEALEQFEEDKFWELNEQIRNSLTDSDRFEAFEQLEDFKKESVIDRAEKYIFSLGSVTPKLCIDIDTNHHEKAYKDSNKIGRYLNSKHPLSRKDFLNR